MKPLSILIVSDSIKNPIGGAFISILRFAEGLSKRGHKIIFIAPRYGNLPAIDDYKGMKIYRFQSFPIPKSEKQYYISFPKVKQIKDIMKKEKIDLLHVILPTPAAIAAIKAARAMGIKTVGHSHFHAKNIFIHLPGFLHNPKFYEAFYNYLVWAYRDVDVIVCPSKLLQKILKKSKYKQKIYVISNGINLSEFKIIDFRPFIKKFNLDENKKRALFIGRLHPEKDIETLIRAVPFVLKKYKNFEVNIVGVGYLRNDLENLTKELGIDKHVKFFGKLYGKELLMAYNACDFFILPSIVETEGMVLLEAMACGKPILVSNSKESASRYFVRKNGFLFKSRNPKSLAKKILRLIKNSNLRKKFGKQSFLNSRKYDIEISVSELEEVYYSLLVK
ncbi:MAG: glycosyltransferase [Nanoarchaeota archaeon]|mgnify:FL=1